jgi:uncharacterized protein (TIGR01370 family)
LAPRAVAPILCRIGGAAALAVAAWASSCAICSRSLPRVSGVNLATVGRWWILIGHSNGLDTVDWGHYGRQADLVVLSDDPRIPLGALPAETLRLGYLSVGEINAESRASRPPARDVSFLVEANPDWPGTVRVDIRDRGWRESLLTDEAPRLLRRGFQGFMLDTLDTAAYLEAKDPARFAGSRQALRDWLAALRDRFPHAILLANGTQSLTDAALYVDGYVVEGLFATYDPARHVYRPTTDSERAWKLAQIAAALDIAQHPVFTIEYADAADPTLGEWAAAESTARGFKPYVTVREINSLP